MPTRVASRDRRTVTRTPESDPQFQQHLNALGLKSSTEYREWCTRHGFAPRLDKSALKRQAEVRAATEAQIRHSLARKPRTPREIIERIFRDEIAPPDTQSHAWSRVTYLYNNTRYTEYLRDRTCELLCHIADCEGFFRPGNASVFGMPYCWNDYMHGLVAVCEQTRYWLRPVTQWKPKCRDPRVLFSGLLRHLFAEYPVPLFMDSVWFADRPGQDLFKHLGKGLNLRTAELPIAYTKRMAHQFMQAPIHYSVNHALRWGQILALGGTTRLAEVICSTDLVNRFEDDEFWVSAFRFFIANPQMDLAHIRPLIDFLRDQRTPTTHIAPNGDAVEVPAPHPNYSLKGRTPASVIRQMEEWHQFLRESDFPDASWAPVKLPAYEQTDQIVGGDERKWTVTELLNSRELIAEGRALHHCVATYIAACEARSSSIWAMRLATSDGISSQATIEVLPSQKTITQARGRYNDPLTGNQRLILNRWAASAGLTVGTYV